MSVLRPEALAFLTRWSEVGFGLGVAAFGLYLMALGGMILIPLGLAVLALGLAWAVLGLRRARFDTIPNAPGLIEIDEGRLRYLHPKMGGEISLHELAELKLITMNGRQIWQATDLAGDGLLLPLDAAGAGQLFDAFASLPGLSSAELVQALSADSPRNIDDLPAAPLIQKRVWHRKGTGLTTQSH